MATKQENELSAKVLKANQNIHTALAGVYNNDPHFRPENKEKVRAYLSEIRQSLDANDSPVRMLDMGCGTGFLIDLAWDLYDEVTGVDITPAMLNQVNKRDGRVKLIEIPAENTELPAGHFHFVSAYSFMDHLVDLKPFLKEVFRVLKPGGQFYSDQNANYHFWTALIDIENSANRPFSAILERELVAALRTEDELSTRFEIDKEEFRDAEYIKSRQNGINPEEFAQIAREIGFKKVEVRFEWFLGQGKVLHQQSKADSQCVETYLREALPLTRHLFKYIQFKAWK